MLEKEEEVINECLNSVEKTDTYLLTNKSFNIKKNIEKKDIENKIFDASTSGEYIDKNKNIEVVENEGTSIKVKQIA